MAKSEITHKSEIYCILSFRLLRSWLDVIMAANITHSASLWRGNFALLGPSHFVIFFLDFFNSHAVNCVDAVFNTVFQLKSFHKSVSNLFLKISRPIHLPFQSLPKTPCFSSVPMFKKKTFLGN